MARPAGAGSQQSSISTTTATTSRPADASVTINSAPVSYGSNGQASTLSAGSGGNVRPLAPTDSHAISISPAYQQVLADLQVRERQRIEDTSARRVEDSEEKKIIFVYWYHEVSVVSVALYVTLSNYLVQDNSPRRVYEIAAPLYPKFHPRDSPELVKLYHVDTDSFEFWHKERWDWVNVAPDGPRRDVSKIADLHYRTTGVTAAPEMPCRRVRDRADSSPEECEPAPNRRRTDSMTPFS